MNIDVHGGHWQPSGLISGIDVHGGHWQPSGLISGGRW